MRYSFKNAGGWNKKRGTVEETPRMDSFEIGNQYRGSISIGAGRKWDLLEYDISYNGDTDLIEFWYNGDLLRETLTVSRLQNGFGNGQTFFVCPICRKRRRFIYVDGGRFVCRTCANLNYQRQQATVDSMFWYSIGMEYAAEHFAPPPCYIDGFSFCEWTPERRRYQHETTYQKHLVRFRRYQLNHAKRLAADMAAIMTSLS